MKRIEYAPDGEPIADHACITRAIAFLKGDQDYIKVSSEIFITASRTLIHQRRYPHQDVVFIFKGEELTIDRIGRFPNRPRGFCDIWTNLLISLLDDSPATDNPL